MKFYAEKAEQYFTKVREDILAVVPKRPAQRILEIGAGGGDTLVALKERGMAAYTVGVELFPMERSNQQNPNIDEFYLGNVEEMELPLQQESFDIILCGDVLEHLLDPWKAVDKLTPYLRRGGLFIVCMPNIRHWSAFVRIYLKGDFKYEPLGIFDKTHFRFFCPRNIEALISTKALKPVKKIPTFKTDKGAYRSRWVNALTLGLFPELISRQYIVISEKL